jgi:hypothetical protein
MLAIPPGATILFGNEFSQWNVPVTGARGMCGTFTALGLATVGCRPLDSDFLDALTTRAAYLHNISAPKRQTGWCSVADAAEILACGLEMDDTCLYPNARALEPIFATLLVGEGLSILMGIYTFLVKRIDTSNYVLLDSHALPHLESRTTALSWPIAQRDAFLSALGALMAARASPCTCRKESCGNCFISVQKCKMRPFALDDLFCKVRKVLSLSHVQYLPARNVFGSMGLVRI